jgi:Na+/melibiose symporter-like transporter
MSADEVGVEEEETVDDWDKPGIRWRTYLSIAMAGAWLVFVGLWLFLFSDEFNNYQNLAIILMVLLIIISILTVPWMYWAAKYDRDFRRQMDIKGFWPRTFLSGVIVFVVFLLIINWLFYHAEEYNLCQNFGMVILLFVLIVVLIAPLWIRWGRKHGWKAKKEHDLGRDISDKVTAEVEKALEEMDRAAEVVDDELQKGDSEKVMEGVDEVMDKVGETLEKVEKKVEEELRK